MQHILLASSLCMLAATPSASSEVRPNSATEPIELVGGFCPDCPDGEPPPLNSGNCPTGHTESSAGCVTNPRRTHYVAPRYPSRLRNTRQEGCASLRVVLSPDGRIEDVVVERATDPHLAKSATKAVKKWRYQPALLADRPVSVRFCVVVKFALR